MAIRTGGKGLDHARPSSGGAEVVKKGGPGADCELIEGVLDIDDQPTGPPHGSADAVDVRHDLPRVADFSNRTRGHEAILQIDHNMGSMLRIEATKYSNATAALRNAAEDVRVESGFVHIASKSLIHLAYRIYGNAN